MIQVSPQKLILSWTFLFLIFDFVDYYWLILTCEKIKSLFLAILLWWTLFFKAYNRYEIQKYLKFFSRKITSISKFGPQTLFSSYKIKKHKSRLTSKNSLNQMSIISKLLHNHFPPYRVPEERIEWEMNECVCRYGAFFLPICCVTSILN